MKVAFIYLSFGMPVMSPAISHLITITKNAGHDVYLVDPTFKFENWKDFCSRQLRKIKPDFVCFSGTTYVFEKTLELAALIKKQNPSAKIIWGGHHATYAPDSVMSSKHVDCAFRGEAEFQLLEYINNQENEEKLRKIEGLSFRDRNGNIIKNPGIPVIEDLNSLPNINYDYWNVQQYLRFGLSFPGALMHFASMGCPYTCTFCNHAAINAMTNRKHYRLKSPKKVIDGIKEDYRKYYRKGFRIVEFSDPIFGLNKNHFDELMDLYVKEGLSKKLPFVCQTRPEVITEDFAKKASEAGCFCVSTGLESGNDYIRMKIYDKRVEKKTFESAIMNLKRHNIRYGLYYIYDGPGENLKSIVKGLDYASRLNPMYIELPRYWPLIGTNLFSELSEKDSINYQDKRKVPALHRKKRKRIEEFSISLYYSYFKYSMMIGKLLRSIFMRKFLFFRDVASSMLDKSNLLVMVKYPLYYFQFYLHLITYFNYQMQEWGKNHGSL